MRRQREKRIQKLLRDHPYLLDKELFNHRGRIERHVKSGRLDIDFDTENGWIVVECKISPLIDKDVKQLRRYIDDLHSEGKIVYKAYLVGGEPNTELDRSLLNRPPKIKLAMLLHDIPTFLALSEGRHYFDANLDRSPYDGSRKIPGQELDLSF